MAAVDKERQKYFMERCMALLAPLGPVTARRMFSGYGIFFDDMIAGEMMFALIVRERLFLKTDGDSQGRFRAAGSEPFTYAKSGKITKVGYYEAPLGSLESSAELLPWAELALSTARAAQAKKPKRRKPA